MPNLPRRRRSRGMTYGAPMHTVIDNQSDLGIDMPQFAQPRPPKYKTIYHEVIETHPEFGEKVVRLVCDYQLFSEMNPTQFIEECFGAATPEAGKIADFHIMGINEGVWGIQLISFYVDVNLPVLDHDTMEIVAEDFINFVIGDTDVNVRMITNAS